MDCKHLKPQRAKLQVSEAPSQRIKSASPEGSGGLRTKITAHMNENVTMEPITAYAIFKKETLRREGIHFLKDMHY